MEWIVMLGRLLKKELEAEEVSAVKEVVRQEAEEQGEVKGADGGRVEENPAVEVGGDGEEGEVKARKQEQQQPEVERVPSEDGGDAYVDDDGIEVVEV